MTNHGADIPRIAEAVMSVPDYPHYELGGFSEWFKGQDPGEEGAVLSVEPTDHTYTDLDGSTKNFESCTIELPDPRVMAFYM